VELPRRERERAREQLRVTITEHVISFQQGCSPHIDDAGAGLLCTLSTLAVSRRVIVRVYRDRKSDFASQLDQKFYNFTSERHRVSSGKWIWVATAEPYNYKEELGGKVAAIKPQMIVLDDPADASLIRGMEIDLGQARSACGSNRNCPTFIPSWVSGEELEATRQVLAAIADRR
jgi:hypothetical protein